MDGNAVHGENKKKEAALPSRPEGRGFRAEYLMTAKECLRSLFITNPLNFSGRAPGCEYAWIFALSCLTGIPTAMAMFGLLGQWCAEHSDAFRLLIGLPLLVPGLSAGFRRVHDFGRSGWFFILAGIVLPIILIILMSVLLVVILFIAYNGQVSQELMIRQLVIGTITLVSSVGILPSIYFMARRGDPAPNKYGDPPAP